MAVLRHVADPAPQRGVDLARAQRSSVQLDLAGGRLDEPGDCVGDRRRAGAAQAEEPDAFAGVHAQAHVVDGAQGRPGRDVAKTQSRLSLDLGRRRRLLADRPCELAADHCGDETPVVELAQRCGDDPLPVAKDGRRVADLVDLLEVVRDVEDGDAARLDTPHTVEEALDRAALERCGRLVEDQKARADRECARDLDDLLLLDRELRDGLVDVEVEAPLE